MKTQTAEDVRLQEDAARKKNWKRWGPYLSDRQWGTVREDYSEAGTCWEYFPHDHARSRVYRWGEDGLLGITDRECRLCFALALWNGRDPILKERLFGLTGHEGNHSEDVKEEYYYLDSTPTHSYMKALYKYPQTEFPYAQLVEENRRRGKIDPEFELADTRVFDESRYFDVFAEYAKNEPDDICIRITVSNRGPEAAPLHVLPTVWFRNVWIWGCTHEGCSVRPRIALARENLLTLQHETLGSFLFEIIPEGKEQTPPILFTNNETNNVRLFRTENIEAFVKDAFHEYIIRDRAHSVNERGYGTKAAPRFVFNLAPNEIRIIRLRLYAEIEAPPTRSDPKSFDAVFASRIREADEFYDSICPRELAPEERNVIRQGYAGLLWNKQFYHYVVDDWLKGDPDMPAPPTHRLNGRNVEWRHFYSRDVLSMPDKWEYPWFAAWDLAFHMIPFARLDGEFAKQQLGLLLREWYMHPNGQIAAYEFAFDDVNPPVHAWAAWRVYKIAGKDGVRDRQFLESVFQKLLINFTWWVNRKDAQGKHLFAGGFLGLDNIGVFDRSKPLPTGGTLQQADGTAWMAFYAATMLAIALELARDGGKIQRAYEDMASKFLEHFVQITDAMNAIGGCGLWDEEDGFYYDRILTDHTVVPLRTRSLVGLLPLIAVEVLEQDTIDRLPGFKKRFEWFLKHRQDLARHITLGAAGHDSQRLLAIPSRERLVRTLAYMLDEDEFLSPFGIRSLSKYHEKHPYEFHAGGEVHRVEYAPGESNTWLFGGNSNWRGPIWFPVNYLLVEALERYHHFYGDDLKVECPTGSGKLRTLGQVAHEIERRLVSLFLPQAGGRPCHGEHERFRDDPHWQRLVLFYEYFHAETGQGFGASHQTGWTALVIRSIKDLARRRARERRPGSEESEDGISSEPG